VIAELADGRTLRFPDNMDEREAERIVLMIVQGDVNAAALLTQAQADASKTQARAEANETQARNLLARAEADAGETRAQAGRLLAQAQADAKAMAQVRTEPQGKGKASVPSYDRQFAELKASVDAVGMRPVEKPPTYEMVVVSKDDAGRPEHIMLRPAVLQ